MADARATSALEYFSEQIHQLESELRELKKSANLVAKRAGLDEPYTVEAPGEARGATQHVKPDEFVAFDAPSAAVRHFLKLRGKDRGAAAPEDILAALQKGGFNVQDGGGLGGLKIALAKDKLVHKLPNGFYGLLEWYPNKKAAPVKKPNPGGGREDDSSDEASEGDEFPKRTA